MRLQRMYLAFLHYRCFKSDVYGKLSVTSPDAGLCENVVEVGPMVIQFLTWF